MPQGPKPIERITIKEMKWTLSTFAPQIFFVFKSFAFGDLKELE